MVEFDENLNPIEDQPTGGQHINPVPSQDPAPAPSWTQPSPSQPATEDNPPKPEPIIPAPTQSPPAPAAAATPTPIAGRGISSGIFALAAIVILGLIGVAMTAIATSGQSNPSSTLAEGITVYGEGVVYATPDIAKLNFGVTETARTIEEVRAKIDDRVDNILNSLDNFDVDDKDIQTGNYSLSPDNDFRYSPPRITGYTGRHTFTLTIRELGSVNDIVDAITQAGANEVGNITFTVEDPEEWVTSARDRAMDQAQTRARAIAESADTHLGKLLSIQESVGNPYDQPIPYGFGGGVMEDMVLSPNIEPGSQEVRVKVTLRYEIG